MCRLKLRLLHVVFITICFTTLTLCAPPPSSSISSADLPMEARNIDSSSQEDDLISTSYVLPKQIFNDGKPYYASKDPISGQLDFSAKKPAGIEPEVNEVIDPKEKIVLSNSSPNIHDFLNLPVKYSSSKFVYPLVSSSYANLKYQGSNKNYVTNKKPTSVIVPPVTPTPGSPGYANNYYTVPTTKLMAVPPTAAGVFTSSTTTTSKKPTSTSTTGSTSTTTSTTSTSTTTTAQPSSSTTKYTTSTRKPLPITTTTYAPRTTPTRKKYVPTKKYSPTPPATTATTPMRFPTEKTRPITSTRQPIPQTSFPTTTTTATKPTTSTKQPIVFTEQPSVPPTPISTRIPNLDPADVYQTLGQKNTEQKFEQKPSMSLADIFNSLAEEESAIAFQNQGNAGFDAQGNILQPIAPSRPSPFAMQQHPGRPQSSMRPTYGTTPQPQSPPTQRYPPNDQKVLSGSQENYSNEYVSYQVQQPNVMQYRPVPGAINNVVISPGQNSATFVLGSQQQVGTNTFGSVEKAPLFSKDPNVQYGTVISEDISSLKRPVSNGPQSAGFPAATTGTYQQTPSNFHQNGIPVGPSGQQYGQRPLGTGSGFAEAPPAPPSPYQQLPLVGTIKRPQSQQPQQQQQQTQQVPYQVPQSDGQNTQQSQTNTHQQGTSTNSNQLRPQTDPQEDKLQAASEETQELLVSTNIRFPANDDQSDEVPPGPFAAGPPAGPQVNGHAQPLSLQQIQHYNPVVFPKASENDQNTAENTGVNKNPQLNEVQYQNGNAAAQDVQIQQHEVLTMNQHKHKLNFPQSIPEQQQQQQQQHIPSQHMEPPPRFPTTVEPQDMHRRPPPQSRPHGGQVPSNYKFNEYTRKPIPSISRPNADRHLPNILPQFRPNAKISSGHPPAYNQEPGNIRITSNQPPKRLMTSSPQFSHRRQPMQQQQRYPMKRISDFPAGPPLPSSPYGDANRRIYRTSPYGNPHPQFDRMHGRRPPMSHSHIAPIADSYAVERHALSADAVMSQMSPTTLEKMAAFEEEDLVINDPPQPVTPSKDRKAEEEAKLEPVVTLQMLQSQKKPVTLSSASLDDSSSGEIQVPNEDNDADTGSAYGKVDSQNGLYVVYPMAADAADKKDDTKDTLPAIGHIEGAPTPTGSEYQNTPFSVMRDQPQEPILKPHKQPQSLQQQQQAKAQQAAPKDKFPYPIEKPDPSYTELNAHNRVPGVLIAPRIMNGPYATGTESPIAIAYTPTEPNAYRRNAALYNHQQQHQALHSTPHNTHNNAANRYSNVNLASAVISEIRPSDTQTEEGLNNDFDVRVQNYEKDFMAPFYPSVSLGGATATANTPSNGWNILPSSTDHSVYEKNNINRADVGEPNEDDDDVESTTKSFELDSFQPELQGGFKPIYPPGYKIEDEQDEHALHLHEDGNKSPVALASRMEPPKGILPHTLPTVVPYITTTISTTAATTTTSRTHLGSTSSTSTTSTTNAPQKSATATPNNSTEILASTSASTTTNPTTTPKPKKKSTFETSLAALLFGEDEDFEDGEARKEKSTLKKTVSGPRSNVPRSGPRNMKLS